MPLFNRSKRTAHTVEWIDFPENLIPLPKLCVINFEAENFDPTLFSDTRIVCPPTIARSVPKRQAEFFYGRLAARLALTKVGATVADISIGPSREPIWPKGVIGSITHTHDLAAAVVLENSSYEGVGIDIEKVGTLETQQALLSNAISATEWSYFQVVTMPPNILLTLAFSSKESLFKAAFPTVGRFFDFDAAEVVHVDVVKKRLSLALRETLSRKLVSGRIVHVYFHLLTQNTIFTSVVLPTDLTE